LKIQRLQQQFEKEQRLKQQLLEQTMSTKNNMSNLQFIQQNNLLSTMNQLQNEHDTEQEIKHKFKIESIINDNRKNEIEQKMKLTNLMNEQLNINQDALKKQSKLNDIMRKQEEFELELMAEQHNAFKENIKENHENLLNQHKNELLATLKQQQCKINKLAKQQRLKQFETMLKTQRNHIESDLSDKDQQLQETIDLVKKQIENLHEKELELELREKEILEKNAFGRIAKDAELQIVNEEKRKYANIREEMLREMQNKEERLRQRHENIMNKLMKEREEQLLSIGQNAKNNVYKEEMSGLEREYEIKRRELKALQERFDAKQDLIRQKLVNQPYVEDE